MAEIAYLQVQNALHHSVARSAIYGVDTCKNIPPAAAKDTSNHHVTDQLYDVSDSQNDTLLHYSSYISFMLAGNIVCQKV